MYIEYEIHHYLDIAEIVKNEGFDHLTRDEAAELVLEIINSYFKTFNKCHLASPYGEMINSDENGNIKGA